MYICLNIYIILLYRAFYKVMYKVKKHTLEINLNREYLINMSSPRNSCPDTNVACPLVHEITRSLPLDYLAV